MDPRIRSRVELETMHELLKELDCYQLLALKPDCPQSEIDVAHRNESRRLHPDRHTAGMPPEFRAKANDVFKAVSDAHRTLRDPDARVKYDNERRAGQLRLSDEARRQSEADVAARNDPSKASKTEKGGKYWKMAIQCWNDADYKNCVMQINFALQLEPDNEVFKEWLEKAKGASAKKALDQKEKGQTQAYKIRL